MRLLSDCDGQSNNALRLNFCLGKSLKGVTWTELSLLNTKIFETVPIENTYNRAIVYVYSPHFPVSDDNCDNDGVSLWHLVGDSIIFREDDLLVIFELEVGWFLWWYSHYLCFYICLGDSLRNSPKDSLNHSRGVLTLWSRLNRWGLCRWCLLLCLHLGHRMNICLRLLAWGGGGW